MKQINKINLKTIRERLPRINDPGQQKSGRNIVIFLGVMIILTTIARGISGATLAVVQTVSASSDEVTRSITGYGSVNARGGSQISAPADLTIEEMLVSGGQKIAADDEIARFDLEEVTEKLDRAKAELSALEVQLKQLEQASTHDSSAVTSAQQELQWAKEDYETTKAAGTKAVTAAREALNTAKQQQEAAQNALNNLSDTETDAREAAQAELVAAEAEVKAAEAAVTEAEDAQTENNRQAKRAVESAQAALSSTQAADAREAADAAASSETDAAEAAAVRLDIAAKNKLIDELQTLSDHNGILLAEADGTILEAKEAGTVTEDGTVATLVQAGNRYEAAVTLPASDARKLTIGDPVELAADDTDDVLEGTISALGDADENGDVIVTVTLPEEEWKLGESIQIRFIISQESYPLTVPLQAVRTESNENYILIIREESTILGLQNVLYKIPVVIQSTGDSLVGIDANIDTSDQIVLTSTKPVSDGDQVRLYGEDEE